MKFGVDNASKQYKQKQPYTEKYIYVFYIDA